MRNTAQRTLAMILCLTMILALQPVVAPTARAAAPEWTAVGGPGLSSSQVYCTSLAIAADGTPYVAYQDMFNGFKATVMKYTGADDTGWEAVGSPGFSAGAISDTSLAIDSGGMPYVAYKDWGIGGGKATVMKYTGAGSTGWRSRPTKGRQTV